MREAKSAARREETREAGWAAALVRSQRECLVVESYEWRLGVRTVPLNPI